jgi:AmmeMemoRadiSam system protein A
MDGKLSEGQGKILLEVARKTIAHHLGEGDLPEASVDSVLAEKGATFVTLKIAHQLRGCIGTLEPVGTLWQGVCDNAISAAFHDHRFSPLTLEELQKVHIEVSVLSSPKPLEYEELHELPQKLRPGIDGVILRDGNRGATFLPQVWQQLPLPELFLGQLCLKAHLTKLIWQEKRLDVQTYQVQYFGEDAV